MQDSMVSRSLGPYELLELIGKGGMARVYKSIQPALERYVAVKLLHPTVAADEEFLARFQREAKAAASLRHSHIVQIFDFGHQGEFYYIVMEFIDGPTLRDELQRLRALDETLPFSEVQRIIGGVSEALDYAHDRGIIHRDVKPPNILLTPEGQAVLSDFGLAFMMEGPRQTITGFAGTPEYMSPEQGQGLAVDGRTDVYSLGVVLYEMLTGRVPFTSRTPIAIIMKHISEPLPPPRLVNPDIPEGVEQVLFKAMSKDPGDRYSRAGELSRALAEAFEAAAVAEVPTAIPFVPEEITEVVEGPEAGLRCANCGAELLPDVRFCGVCGADLGVEETIISRMPPPPPLAYEQPSTPPTYPTAEEVEVERFPSPTVAFPSAVLLVVKGESMGSEYFLETDSTVIGRASECDVTLKDEAASRQHTRLSREGDHFILSDLESANGTFVDEQQISGPWELRDGERIRIGETVLEFRELMGPDELNWQGKPDRLVALQNDWQGAVKSFHNDEAFRSHATAIVANIGDSLGFKMLNQGEKRQQLISFPLDAPTLRLKIPPAFPAFFLQRELVTRRDAEDLRDLMDDLGASNRFGLFMALQDPQKTRALFDETLRSMCDLVVLDKEDVARVVRMRDHRQALMESILNQVDLMVVSPFVTAGPVPENMFFGRENEIRTIVQTIRNNSMAILGGRRIGKTSTLQKVERLLSRSGSGYRVLYMNCQDVSNYEEFFRSVNVDWEPPEPITDFSPISFKEFMIKLKSGKGPIVVILDETDRILRYDMDNDEKLFKVFRGLSEEGYCQFLFSGERILGMQMRDSRSPLFNFCNPLPLRYLERKDAEQLITEPMALMGIELQRPSELVEQILNVSSCHPRMVQYICHQLIQRISHAGTRIIRLDDLHKVTTSGAFYNDYIETIWAQALPLERLITLIMTQHQDQADSEISVTDQTMMIVEGLTSSEIWQALGDLGIELKARQVNMALDNLQLYAIVERKAKRYRFIPQAFPRFLKEAKEIPETVVLLVEQIEDEGIA